MLNFECKYIHLCAYGYLEKVVVIVRAVFVSCINTLWSGCYVDVNWASGRHCGWVFRRMNSLCRSDEAVVGLFLNSNLRCLFLNWESW